MSPSARNRRANQIGRPEGRRLAIFCAILSLLLSAIVTVPLVPAVVGPDVQVGLPAPYTIKAPRTTRYASQVLAKADREAAAKAVADVYRFDPVITSHALRSLSNTLGLVETIVFEPDAVPAEQSERLLELDGVAFTTETVAFLLTISEDDWSIVEREALRLYDVVTYDQFNPGSVRQLRAQDIASLRDSLIRRVQPTLATGKRTLVVELVSPFLVPNYVVDEEETERRREEARAKTPPHYVDVLEGELIVYEGQIVHEVDLEKMEATGLRDPAVSWMSLLGKVLLVVGLMCCYGLLLYRFQDKAVLDVRGLSLIGLVMVVTVIGAKFLVPDRVGFAYAFPLPTAAILLTLLLSPAAAVGAAIVLAILAGLLSGGSLALVVLGIVGSVVGLLGIWKAQRSTAFLLTGFYVTLANIAVVGTFSLIERSLNVQAMAIAVLASLINGFASAALSFATFGFLGTIFGRVTVLQLMELSNPNHPLLHRLMQEAPGTYYHSIIVGNLAERAAEVVGADPMLVRVGAYYHDIGKIVRPFFFIDNQAGRSNIHDDLSPRISAQIITDHVRDGIALARKYRLPERIVQFIPQHHGTTTATYFYRRALQEDEAVNREDYRYPGPKPQSREAAILMLADSVEATVRSMNQSGKLKDVLDAEKDQEATEPLTALVAQIIEERIQDGQLDESDLTFRDIGAIRQAFVEMLRGVYHPRVVYPEFGKAPESGGGAAS